MKTVLIVDDSLYMRTMISDALSKAGYTIIAQAANGEAAIDMAMEHKPDLITLDNILPDMIGTDILRVLKQDEEDEFQSGDDKRGRSGICDSRGNEFRRLKLYCQAFYLRGLGGDYQ